MGMYDEIRAPDARCKHCGESIDGELQSKDGPCALDTLEFYEVDNFYGSCRKCGKWNEFVRKTPRPPIPLSFYEQTLGRR